MGLAWVEVAVAVTEARSEIRSFGGLVMAAVALPGVMPTLAHAELAPEAATVSLKSLSYRESQPGLDRVSVDALAANVVVPIGHQWSLDWTGVRDLVSGATPRKHTVVSSASHMSDQRFENGVKVTRYFERAAVGVNVSNSHEHDYTSNAWAIDGRLASDDQNTTFNAGFGRSNDDIHAYTMSKAETKTSNDVMIGVTQAWSSLDLVQLNLTHKSASGFMTDPYKTADQRPDSRTASVVLARWNHHYLRRGTTVRSTYRYYNDSYGVSAHTVEAEYVMPMSQRLTLTPSGRYYAQRAASFYFDPNTGNPTGTYFSADQRLSAYGAVTIGVKADWTINRAWGVNAKYERYEQRSDWRITGKGSPGLDAFSATFLQLGLNYRF